MILGYETLTRIVWLIPFFPVNQSCEITDLKIKPTLQNCRKIQRSVIEMKNIWN